jgi:hypothetical protein
MCKVAHFWRRVHQPPTGRKGKTESDENNDNAAITSNSRIMYVTDVFTERGDTRRVKPTYVNL